jgi:hypothetical protein
MFDRNSRYAPIETATLKVTAPDGQPREVVYKRRRFIPSAEGTTTLAYHQVSQSDRVDNVTARYLGDPLNFWQVCDANAVLRPDQLLDDIGDAIRIALPRL